jgi:hypothetical protein
MGRRIDDEMLEAFAVVAEPPDVAAAIIQRYGGLFTRLHLYVKTTLDDETMRTIVAGLKGS